MTTAGLVVFDLALVALIAWVLDSVRRGRLYVGYALALVIMLAASGLVASVPPLLHLVRGALSQLFPAAPLLTVVCGIFVVVIVYLLTQVTLIAHRLATVVQALALEDARRGRSRAADGPESSR